MAVDPTRHPPSAGLHARNVRLNTSAHPSPVVRSGQSLSTSARGLRQPRNPRTATDPTLGQRATSERRPRSPNRRDGAAPLARRRHPGQWWSPPGGGGGAAGHRPGAAGPAAAAGISVQPVGRSAEPGQRSRGGGVGRAVPPPPCHFSPPAMWQQVIASEFGTLLRVSADRLGWFVLSLLR